MEKIIIEGERGKSEILVGETIERVSDYLPEKDVFIITDENVNRLYKKVFPSFPVHVIEPGEASKDFQVVAGIYHWLLENGADRGSFIVGIGGGVVCDIAGFVAATFMRGVDFGFVATSLLAQVDASVGGKNGVNLQGYKNIVGTFTQPRFVICDTHMLKTLPPEEFTNGMAEVIKHALIRDEEKFAYLQTHKQAILNCQPEKINHIVTRSVMIKASIVRADELERGERRLLNFGHTWGHAIEKVSKIPHGQAVAVGMIFATGLSVKYGYLDTSHMERISKVLQDYGLPVMADIDNRKVFDAMLKDKKREKELMNFILLEKPGKAFVEKIPTEKLKSFAL